MKEAKEGLGIVNDFLMYCVLFAKSDRHMHMVDPSNSSVRRRGKGRVKDLQQCVVLYNDKDGSAKQ